MKGIFPGSAVVPSRQLAGHYFIQWSGVLSCSVSLRPAGSRSHMGAKYTQRCLFCFLVPPTIVLMKYRGVTVTMSVYVIQFDHIISSASQFMVLFFVLSFRWNPRVDKYADHEPISYLMSSLKQRAWHNALNGSILKQFSFLLAKDCTLCAWMGPISPATQTLVSLWLSRPA